MAPTFDDCLYLIVVWKTVHSLMKCATSKLLIIPKQNLPLIAVMGGSLIRNMRRDTRHAIASVLIFSILNFESFLILLIQSWQQRNSRKQWDITRLEEQSNYDYGHILFDIKNLRKVFGLCLIGWCISYLHLNNQLLQCLLKVKICLPALFLLN